jgi:L-seryl-tRNA(Ser) seleniumtransferase
MSARLDDGHKDGKAMLRRMPSIGRLLASAEFQALADAYSRPAVLGELRRTLDGLRGAAQAGRLQEADLALQPIHSTVLAGLRRNEAPYYCRVINATGIVLHTALGRATLAPDAIEAIRAHAGRPLRVEFDLEHGSRGGRDEGCSRPLRELTGCEAATVVNNNAAATLLILGALGAGRRVLVSRGELVEMGGSFRVPEIMQQSGATLVEVGTTNRTHLSDYSNAIGADTGLILKVHTSNYRLEGFTCDVPIQDLVKLGRRAGIPVVHDLGSGSLLDLSSRLGTDEPMVSHSVTAGADAICFSGDKLLGGPQAGIIVGTAAAVDQCRRHPLYRAVRPCRLTYLALEATLRVYLGGSAAALARIPALKLLVDPPSAVRARALGLLRRLRGIPNIEPTLIRCESQAGSGSLPARNLQSWGVRIASAAWPPHLLAAELRSGTPPIIARVRQDAVVLDLRCMDREDCAFVSQRFFDISMREPAPAAAEALRVVGGAAIRTSVQWSHG